MKTLIITIYIIFTQVVMGKSISITIDDCPLKKPSLYLNQVEKTRKILSILDRYKVRAKFICNLSKKPRSKATESETIVVYTQDHYLNDIYVRESRGRGIIIPRMKELYLDHIMERIDHYLSMGTKEKLSYALILNENDLLSIFLDDLIKKLKSKGFEIVSPQINIKRAKPPHESKEEINKLFEKYKVYIR